MRSTGSLAMHQNPVVMDDNVLTDNIRSLPSAMHAAMQCNSKHGLVHLPQLSHDSGLCRKVFQGAEIVVAAQQATGGHASIQPQHIIALLASLAWRGSYLQEAGVICAPSCAWDMEKVERLGGLCAPPLPLLCAADCE